MKLPGFVADASLYRCSARHRALWMATKHPDDQRVHPAIFNEGGGGTTTDDLTKQGYHCEVVSAGFVECTKEGSPSYWCTYGSCTPAPAKHSGLNGLGLQFGTISRNQQSASFR